MADQHASEALRQAVEQAVAQAHVQHDHTVMLPLDIWTRIVLLAVPASPVSPPPGGTR